MEGVSTAKIVLFHKNRLVSSRQHSIYRGAKIVFWFFLLIYSRVLRAGFLGRMTRVLIFLSRISRELLKRFRSNLVCGVLKLAGVSTAKIVLFNQSSTELRRCENCVFVLPVNILTSVARRLHYRVPYTRSNYSNRAVIYANHTKIL